MLQSGRRRDRHRVGHRGSLGSIGTSPLADPQTAPCWVEITHDGKFLSAVNTAQPSMSRYAILADGSLPLLGSTPFDEPQELGPFDARPSPDGGTLWVVDSGPLRSVPLWFASESGWAHRLRASWSES